MRIRYKGKGKSKDTSRTKTRNGRTKTRGRTSARTDETTYSNPCVNISYGGVDADTAAYQDHAIMEKVKSLVPDYQYRTEGMNEEEKIMYDHGLKQKFVEAFGDPYASWDDRR